jgi:hypothetical protein
MYSAVCGYNVSADAWNTYEFQTEIFINDIGVNIYDAAVWAIASAVLGDVTTPSNYHANVLLKGSTLQITDIKGDAPCKGVMAWGECSDPKDTGVCGLCYGDQKMSFPKQTAYFFRMITDYFSLQNTTMDLCPEKNLPWTWNDWKPITGENAWAGLVGALQVAYMRAGNNINAIPDNCPEMQLAINLIPAFEAMQIPLIGAVHYAPHNTFYFGQPNIGSSVSTENNASLLSGLKMLLQILTNTTSPTYKSYITRVQNLISGIEHYLQMAYDKDLGFFRQGGTFYPQNNTFDWGQGAGIPLFATDCQTWVAGVLGPETVDGWFGAGTSLNIWNTTKAIAGYATLPNGQVKGVGYTNNSADQVFSGEWTFGAINWLRVMANSTIYDSSTVADLLAQANLMRASIDAELTTTHPMRDGNTGSSVLYANKRYFIPFGWWANALPSTASTGWAVLADNNFNPFVLGGAYMAA